MEFGVEKTLLDSIGACKAWEVSLASGIALISGAGALAGDGKNSLVAAAIAMTANPSMPITVSKPEGCTGERPIAFRSPTLG